VRKVFTFLLLIVLPYFAFAETVPKSLVGTWATKESEFQGEQLIGGAVLYLSESGQAAMVGAPLPVKRCDDGRLCTPIIGFPLTVSDVSENKLSLSVSDGNDKIMMIATFDSVENILLLNTSKTEALRLVHLRSSLPDFFTKAIKDAKP
jgi:hypothetical protein